MQQKSNKNKRRKNKILSIENSPKTKTIYIKKYQKISKINKPSKQKAMQAGGQQQTQGQEKTSQTMLGNNNQSINHIRSINYKFNVQNASKKCTTNLTKKSTMANNKIRIKKQQ